jgi:hypothetical protein
MVPAIKALKAKAFSIQIQEQHSMFFFFFLFFNFLVLCIKERNLFVLNYHLFYFIFYKKNITYLKNLSR